MRTTLTLFALAIATALHAQELAPPTLQTANAAFQQQRWEEAVEQYRALATANPKQGVAWFRLGYALHAIGRLDEAVKAHRKAGEFPAFRPVALYNLGCAEALRGRPEDAFAALDAAADAGFRNQGQIEGDADLASLRSDPRYAAFLGRLANAVPARRQFDFWLGSWDVFNPAGKQVGTNVITLRQNGNIVHENWTSASGGGGESINFFDPGDRLWKQVWVDAGGGVVRYSGSFQNGAMRFTSGENIQANGTKAMSRASFTPRKDGRVRQLIEHSRDGGKTWTTYFDGMYVRQEAKKEKSL